MKPQNIKRFSFVWLFTLSGIIGTTVAGDDCIVKEVTVICEHSIPLVLPTNTSGVIIKDYLHETISNATFAHESWSTINLLDITVTDDVRFRLLDRNFPLLNLQNLGIHSPSWRFTNSSAYVLEGLPRLNTLNLSLCHNFNASDVVTMLFTVEHLDTLILDQLAIFGARFLYFENTFVETVREKKVRKLSLSGCNLYVQSPFQVRHPLIHLFDFDLSNTTIVFTGGEYITELITEELLPNLKILDLSFLGNRFLSLNLEFVNNVFTPHACFRNNGFINMLLKVEYIKLNNILLGTVTGNNTLIDFSICKTNVKSVEIRSNNLRYLNVTVLWPKNNTSAVDIDLSSNDLEYLSPSFLGSVTSLEIIKLADNKLHLMESFQEFEHLFTEHKRLQQLDLSKNLLKILPFKIFWHNVDLIMIDLSQNKLTSITFSLKTLVKLKFLNLRNNDISFIDSIQLNDLNIFAIHSSEHFQIHLENNPIICTCESIPFMKWLHLYRINTYNKNPTCSYGDRVGVGINKSFIKKVEYSCNRAKIITASVTTVMGMILSVAMAIVFVLYRKKQRDKTRKRGNFLKDFKLGKLNENYLCFVSYSSDDDEAQIRQINARIKKSLQEIIRTDREVLCENSEHFNLGFPIINEVMRCIAESCVGLFIVTNNFCQSHWCECELRETYDLKKPIILIFKEEIDERDMSPLMLKIFRKFTRAKIIESGDVQVEMIPDVKQLSNSIIKLASLRYDEDIEHN